MSYEKMLMLILAFVSVIQFYLSFIKGRSSIKDFGKEIYRLRINAMKQGFLGLLFVFILFYLFYSFIKSNFSTLGILIVIYVLLSIFDFSKVKVITDKGIGQKNFYNKQFYNFTLWNDMTAYEWSSSRQTMLIYKFNKKGKVLANDWEVCLNDKDEVERLFKENVKIKIENIEIKLNESQDK